MGAGRRATTSVRWRGIDVGSPFEHAKSGILYVAAHLPPPGRDGTGSAEQLDEIAALITAAGGRTLGLFSSMRAAKAAAEIMRDRLDTPVLCQGEDTTSALVKRFAEDAETSLFGTLSLWQGVDVPGPSLSLVLIDRIPFPRPDDPLLTARQRAVAARGGNGFMAVAASHAALLLAQGAGRLLRTHRRPGRRRGARLADGHRPVRRISAGIAATVLGDHRPGSGPRRRSNVYARADYFHYPVALTPCARRPGRRQTPKGGVHEPTTPGGRRDRGVLGAARHVVQHDAAGQSRLGVRRPVQRRGHARHRRAHAACDLTPRSRRATWRAPTTAISTNSAARRSATSKSSGKARTASRSTASSEPVEELISWDANGFDDTEFCGNDTYGLVNAGYCLDDHTIGWDRGELLPALQEAHGDMGVTMVLAHEYGHAVQYQAGMADDDTPRWWPSSRPTAWPARTCAGSPKTIRRASRCRLATG